MANEDILPVYVENLLSIFNIENKYDSQERLEAVAGVDTKLVLFAPEFNSVKHAAIQASLDNIIVDFSWSNHKNHIELNKNGIDQIQLLVMNFDGTDLIANSEEVTLLIDRYKGKKKQRCASVNYELTIVSIDDTKLEDIISFLSNKSGVDENDLRFNIQTLPYTFFTTKDVNLSNMFTSEFTNQNYGVLDSKKIELEDKFKKSGWRRAIYPDVNNPNRPSEVLINNSETILKIGYEYYFKPILPAEDNMVRSKGYYVNRYRISDIVFLQFRLKAIIDGKTFISNVKCKVSTKLAKIFPNAQNLNYKYYISHKLL